MVLAVECLERGRPPLWSQLDRLPGGAGGGGECPSASGDESPVRVHSLAFGFRSLEIIGAEQEAFLPLLY